MAFDASRPEPEPENHTLFFGVIHGWEGNTPWPRTNQSSHSILKMNGFADIEFN